MTENLTLSKEETDVIDALFIASYDIWHELYTLNIEKLSRHSTYFVHKDAKVAEAIAKRILGNAQSGHVEYPDYTRLALEILIGAKVNDQTIAEDLLIAISNPERTYKTIRNYRGYRPAIQTLSDQEQAKKIDALFMLKFCAIVTPGYFNAVVNLVRQGNDGNILHGSCFAELESYKQYAEKEIVERPHHRPYFMIYPEIGKSVFLSGGYVWMHSTLSDIGDFLGTVRFNVQGYGLCKQNLENLRSDAERNYQTIERILAECDERLEERTRGGLLGRLSRLWQKEKLK